MDKPIKVLNEELRRLKGYKNQDWARGDIRDLETAIRILLNHRNKR